MLGFASALILPRRSFQPSGSLCSASKRLLRTSRSAVRATYVTDLQTLAQDIPHSSTDALVNDITTQLRDGADLAEQTLQKMVLHLGDSRGMARLSLVESFGKVGSPAVPLLLTALKTCPNPVVRRSCGKALAKIGDARATDSLLHTLVYDEDTVTRSSAAGALARMGAIAVPKLLELISDSQVSMTAKGHAAWAISFMQGSASDALFDSLKHPNQDVRIAVVSALGAVAMGDALPTMGAGADDDWGDNANDDIRLRAIVAMRTALKDESSQVRAEAVNALANAGCNEDADAIASFLGDEDPELRRCAALALMKIPDQRFVAVLRERQEDEEDESVRNVISLAANAIERIRGEDDDWD
ncbi:Bilin biosynthesis protein MpeU [Gracilariopsis chorda]|uniref:Bilin biosynthesis protein MpeU n=1 Tax=Gracilariopsis chorda TaxID=448386 RepID=A0A2V3IYG8_9FLOR|nr:Bilin biosynthesis protein MpeU [Gracilariopsis chorda]|eukprot:PXF46727.1 Bilin biosynthesis protein MpeU [Gracilariopsis chorda]